MNFESAYIRLQEIYNTINSQEILDIDKLSELQVEADGLYVFLQSIINKPTTTPNEVL